MKDLLIPPTEIEVAELVRAAGSIAIRLAYQRDTLLEKVDHLSARLHKAQQNAARQCSHCGGYWLSLSEGARICICVSELEEIGE